MKRVNRILAHRAGKRGGRVQAEVAFGFVLPLQPCLTAAFLYRAGSSLVCQARWIRSVLLLSCFIVVVQSERERGDLSFEPNVPLETQAQCGDLSRQCWDTRTYSSTPRQQQPVSFNTAWLEMAAGRGYGGSNVMLLRNESSTDMSLVAMLASCSPLALPVPRLDDSAVGQKRPYYPMFEASGEDPGEEDLGDDCTQHVEKKRRLTFDQVRSLERNFEVENKLEPERKIQLAKELGLQPRQVAVWFQNRRARWKTKQLERDYEVLTSDFNRLKSEFEAVLQEKQELQGEMECLTGKIQTTNPNPVEKTRTTKTSTPPAAQKLACEGSGRLERLREPIAASKDCPTPRGEGGSKETSANSISSEILDADSPRTSLDSGALLPLENADTYPQISPELVDSSIIHVSDTLNDHLLSPRACQRISVKLEDDSYQDESCISILTQMDEERGLPWWDWP